jgi:hypothetical protein
MLTWLIKCPSSIVRKGGLERLHFWCRECWRLHQTKDWLGKDEPHKMNDALLPSDKVAGDDNVPDTDGKQDSGEDTQDDEDVHPGG